MVIFVYKISSNLKTHPRIKRLILIFYPWIWLLGVWIGEYAFMLFIIWFSCFFYIWHISYFFISTLLFLDIDIKYLNWWMHIFSFIWELNLELDNLLLALILRCWLSTIWIFKYRLMSFIRCFFVFVFICDVWIVICLVTQLRIKEPILSFFIGCWLSSIWISEYASIIMLIWGILSWCCMQVGLDTWFHIGSSRVGVDIWVHFSPHNLYKLNTYQ